MASNKKVDILDFLEFRRNYFEGNRDERLGQAFLNKFFPHSSDQVLWNEQNIEKAEGIILEKYISQLQEQNEVN